jgi:pyruvate kinase
MRRHRHAKIVATLGPASSNVEMIRALFTAGSRMYSASTSHAWSTMKEAANSSIEDPAN